MTTPRTCRTSDTHIQSLIRGLPCMILSMQSWARPEVGLLVCLVVASTSHQG